MLCYCWKDSHNFINMSFVTLTRVINKAKLDSYRFQYNVVFSVAKWLFGEFAGDNILTIDIGYVSSARSI